MGETRRRFLYPDQGQRSHNQHSLQGELPLSGPLHFQSEVLSNEHLQERWPLLARVRDDRSVQREIRSTALRGEHQGRRRLQPPLIGGFPGSAGHRYHRTQIPQAAAHRLHRPHGTRPAAGGLDRPLWGEYEREHFASVQTHHGNKCLMV